MFSYFSISTVYWMIQEPTIAAVFNGKKDNILAFIYEVTKIPTLDAVPYSTFNVAFGSLKKEPLFIS